MIVGEAVRQPWELEEILGHRRDRLPCRYAIQLCDDGSVLDHVSIQCADLGASATFYDAVLAPLGGARVLDAPDVIGYGTPPTLDFCIGAQTTGDGFRETHLAFAAPTRDAVDAFFAAAVAVGAVVLYEPKLWPEYHANYYGAFVRDPDGNNVEACSHTTA
jgi:catechol 2,3-dioxygenase-like lactoylglutathione lyase family enzyme